MTRSLSGTKLTIKLSASLRNTLDDGTVVPVAQPNLSYSQSLASGIEAGEANRAWQRKSGELAGGAQVTFDLLNMVGVDIGAGEGRDALGQLVVFEEIVAIAIVNENAVGAAGMLEVKPASSKGWAPIGTHTVATGGALAGQGVLLKAQPAAAGFDVAGASSYRITLGASGGPVTYSIYLLARHDDEESSSSSVSSQSSASSQSSSSSPSSISGSMSESSISTSSESSSVSSASSASSTSSSESSSSVSI